MNTFTRHTYPGDVPVVPPAGVLPLSRLRLAAEVFFCFAVGGMGYYLLEVLFRGYSHPSMALAGGLCFLLLYALDARLPRTPLPLRALGGALVITAVEFAVGVVVNLWLGLDVWDYSAYRLSLLGQICLPFTGLWFLVCIPAMAVCRLLRRRVFTRR